MKEVVYKHKDYPQVFTVTHLDEAESKSWNGDRYISHGPSTVILETSRAVWNWSEYDYPSEKAEVRIENIIAAGWEAQS